MNILKSTKKTSSIFLAIVLVAGTFAVISPSPFITGVNAQSETYYGMDKDRKDISVSSLKCNNINVNVNGLELDVLPSFLGGELVDEAQESTTDASSFAGNGADGSEIHDFRFICINNNNNTVVEERQPELVTCEDCFRQNLNTTEFENLEETLATGTLIFVGGEFIAVFSLEEFCEAVEDATALELANAIFFVLNVSNFGLPDETVTNIILCIADVLGKTITFPI